MKSMKNYVILILILMIISFSFVFLVTVLESDFPITKQIKSNPSPQTNQLLSYKLAVFWPKGTCLEYINTPCYKKRAALPNMFTIHGLWVIDRSGSKEEFDKNLLKDLKKDLKTNWPDIKSFDKGSKKAKDRHKKANAAFWKREWNKHGRVDPLFKYEFHEYFEHTLRLLRELDVTNILINLEGKPDTPQLVREALQMHHLTIPLLLCVNDKVSGQVYLAELQFCMDDTAMGYVDCDPDEGKDDAKKCKEGRAFIYDSDAIAPTPSMIDPKDDDVAGELELVQVI